MGPGPLLGPRPGVAARAGEGRRVPGHGRCARLDRAPEARAAAVEVGHAVGLPGRAPPRWPRPCAGWAWTHRDGRDPGVEEPPPGKKPAAHQDEENEGKDRPKLTSVASALVRELDCAVLAMRYPVGDEFAIALASTLYRGVLEQGQGLTRALQLALPETIPGQSPLCVATPVLFGRRAADLTLDVPETPWDKLGVPTVGGLTGFPPQHPHFVGRVGVMAKAGAALAPRSGRTGVLFHGMSGGQVGLRDRAVLPVRGPQAVHRLRLVPGPARGLRGRRLAGRLRHGVRDPAQRRELRGAVPAGGADRGRGRQVQRLPAPAPRFPDEAERAAGPRQPGDPAPPRRRLDRPTLGEGRRDAAGPRGL